MTTFVLLQIVHQCVQDVNFEIIPSQNYLHNVFGEFYSALGLGN